MSEPGAQDQPADDVRARTSANPAAMWLLLTANRRVLTAGMTAFVLLAVAAADATGTASLTDAVAAGDPISTLFQALVGSIITGVTLVVTLSQLVLSQELGAVGDQWERMQAAMDFRERAEQQLEDSTASPEPAGFLRSLVAAAARQAREVIGTLGPDAEGREARRVRDFAEEVIDNAADVGEQLEDAHFGTFAVVSGALDFNYSWKIHQARRMLGSDDLELPDDCRAVLGELLGTLTLFGPAREHFKTLYFEWELINLSRGMVYLAVPALAVSVVSLLYLETASLPAAAVLGASTTAWVVALAVAVAVSPFVLLLAYILRIVTVAKLTLAMGPFILRRTDRSGEADSGV